MSGKPLYNVQGREWPGNGVTAYLGLKYASLRTKFSPPILNDMPNSGPNTIRATTWGPAYPGPDGCEREQRLMFQHKLPRDGDEEDSRKSILDYLTLNIARPASAEDDTPLPVLVFIHGGGFKSGCTNWPQNQTLNLVKHSLRVGRPIIGVTINYRIGPFGFLSSAEMRSAGYLANNGLRDQRVALQWIQKHIGGFGGDPENVTLMGHGTGGVSATLHLASDQPLFKRLISMSGTLLSMRPVSVSEEQQTYELSMQLLGLGELSMQDRLATLENMDPGELMAKIPPFVPLGPVIDGDFCSDPVTFERLNEGFSKRQHKRWCKDILLGDCQFGASILSLPLSHRKKDIGKDFHASLDRTLRRHPPSVHQEILQAYNIISDRDSNNEIDEKNFINILQFCQDIKFSAPIVTIGRGWTGGDAYLYHFKEPNPWDGMWKGYASHGTDLAFALLNYGEYLEEPQRRLAEAFATDIVHFAHGDVSWPRLDVTGSAATEIVAARVYGPVDEVGSSPLVVPETDAREGPIWALCDKFGADVLLDACDAFLAGR